MFEEGINFLVYDLIPRINDWDPYDARWLRVSERAETFSRETVSEIRAELAKGRLANLAQDICRGGQQSVNVRADLAQLAGEIPVRALVGMQDRIVDWRDAIDVSLAIAVHVFPRAGHMPHWDAPAEVATILGKELHHV